MKVVFALCSFIFSVVTNAQVKKNIHIDSAGIVNIYGKGNVIIGKAVVRETLQTKIYLLTSEQSKDTSGIYTTVLGFGNKEKIPMFGVDLVIKFSSPVISVNGGRSGDLISAAGGNMIYTFLSKDHRELIFKASQVDVQPFSDTMIIFEIKSAHKITFTVAGLKGSLHR